MEHPIYKIQFKKYAYPTVKHCLDYFKHWNLYGQLLTFIENKSNRDKCLTFEVTDEYINFYISNNHNRNIKVTAITIHHTPKTNKVFDVYYYHSDTQPEYNITTYDNGDGQEIGYLYHGTDMKKTVSKFFEKMKYMSAGYYSIMNHHGYIHVVNLNRYRRLLNEDSKKRRDIPNTYYKLFKNDEKLVKSGKISEKEAIWRLLENV